MLHLHHGSAEGSAWSSIQDPVWWSSHHLVAEETYRILKVSPGCDTCDSHSLILGQSKSHDHAQDHSIGRCNLVMCLQKRNQYCDHPNDILTMIMTGTCIFRGLMSYVCTWNIPRHVPTLFLWLLSFASLILPIIIPWQCLTFSFFQRNFSEEVAMFLTDGVSHSILLSHFSDTLTTEESKRGPVINDM